MSAGLWFVVGAVVGAIALVVAGGVRLAFGARTLAMRIASLSAPDIDFERAQATIAKLQRDAVRARILIVRAHVALRNVDDGLHAMIRAFVGG